MKKNNHGGFDIDEILKILPHRYPFVLIDRVLEVIEPTDKPGRVGRKVRARKCVSYNEAYFAGHFPHKPVMPGVLIVESMAQAGALACFRAGDPPMDVAIGRISETRIRRPVIPGDVLDIEAEVIKDRGSMVVIRTCAAVDQELVTEAEILATVTAKEM